MVASLNIIVPSAILLAGLVDDLKTRKIHNWLSILCLAIAVAYAYYAGGWPQVQQGLFGIGVAFAMTLPLVLIGALGAGDMKLLLAFGMATDIITVFWVVIYSFAWGALLGVVKSILNKDFIHMLKNMVRVVSRQQPKTSELSSIPYTVAFLFAWLTYLTLHHQQVGGPIW